MNPVSIRLLNQQLVAPQFTRPEQVVAHFGAMQAQEYRLMRWAVEMRTKHPSERAFEKAFNKGKIVRLHLHRGTWQLVAAQDYRWMLDLLGQKARQVICGWMSSNKITIPDDELLHIRTILTDTAARKGSVTKEDFDMALADKGIVMDNHRLSYHIRFAELDGVLCSGNLLPMKATYALTENKIPRQEKIDRTESLMLLARKYFQSHQPATLQDFVWWSGLGLNDCRKAIGLLGNDIHTETFMGRDFHLLSDCRTRGFHKGEYLFIPPYDEYLIGYKSRDVVLAPEHSHYAHNNSGIFQPVIAHDGIICGNWKPFSNENAPTFFTEGYNPCSTDAAWNNYLEYRK